MGDTNFEFAIRDGGRRPTVLLRGDLDAYTGPRFAECMRDAVTAARGDLAVDMSGVSFVDSSGIAILVSVAKELRERGNTLVLQSPPRMVNKLLEMTGVNKLVRLERR